MSEDTTKKPGFFKRLFGWVEEESASDSPAEAVPPEKEPETVKDEALAVQQTPSVEEAPQPTITELPHTLTESTSAVAASDTPAVMTPAPVTPEIPAAEIPKAILAEVTETPALKESVSSAQEKRVPAPEEPVPAAEEQGLATEEAPPTKEGFFRRLIKQLSRTQKSLVEKVRGVIRLHGKVNEELLEEIETILIQADVGIETTTKIIEQMRKNSEARKTEGADALIALFKEALMEIVSHDERVLKLREKSPTVIMFVGVNGTGKTTTIGKIAKEYHLQGKRVLMVAADTFRAAAIEQLTLWSGRIGVDIFKKQDGADPASVCFEALNGLAADKYDVVLIDTAGRLHTRSNLMEELKKMVRVIKKVLPDAPHETILVLDATTGQNALNQAKIFSEAVEVTGLIMTKLDGTAKGGILIALRNLFDIPILKIGIGESEHDLRDFDPEAYVDALFETE